MSIVSSVLDIGAAQADGRIWAHEVHTDNVGLKYEYRYLSEAGLDRNAVMAARATQLAADLVQAELNANIAQVLAAGSQAALTANYATLAQIRTALRAAYQSATQLQAIMLGDFLSGLTDGQLGTLFGISNGAVTTLRTNKLTPAANTAAAIRAAAAGQ